MLSTQSLSGCTATVRASKQIGNSMYSIPPSLADFISSADMGRLAFEMSVSPRTNFLKPPPVPDDPTVTLIFPPVDFWNSSATASATGNTVLEPSSVTMAPSLISSRLTEVLLLISVLPGLALFFLPHPDNIAVIRQKVAPIDNKDSTTWCGRVDIGSLGVMGTGINRK